MQSVSFQNMCLFNVHDGLRAGLSHFSPPSRAALIYSMNRNDPVRIHDPLSLLRGHEPKLDELFLTSAKWRDTAPESLSDRFPEPIALEEYDTPLSGLISYACRSESLFFQMWFTEEHPDMCSTGPTERWLEYAAGLLVHNLGSEGMFNIGTSDYVLRQYATHAVRDHIVDRRNMTVGWDTQLRIFPILDTILGVSKTKEEGAWPRGELVFVEPAFIGRINFMVRFPGSEGPSLVNHKHVRKLLMATEESGRKLVSDGRHIIGVTADAPPISSLSGIFLGGYGFLKLDDEYICSFSDGSFHSSTRRTNMVQVEELLLETDLDPSVQHDLFQVITSVVHGAGRGRHGCTVVLDLNNRPLNLPGQTLEHPLDLTNTDGLDLAKSLARVDGALHISADARLQGFACLLDGHTVPGENRARGARFNSALRFTAEHPELIVVVVSADRPVSVIRDGVELTAQCEWAPVSVRGGPPPTLDEWLKG